MIALGILNLGLAGVNFYLYSESKKWYNMAAGIFSVIVGITVISMN